MNILLIRLRLIGDVVFTTPAVRAVRRRYPQARISYLVEAAAAPIVQDNPHLDDVIVVTRSRGWRRLLDDARLAVTLRARRFDLVIDFHGGPRSAWLAWATGARTRIGYKVAGRAWMYTRQVDRPRELRPRHSVRNQWDLLEPLGIEPPDPRRDPTEMPARPGVGAEIDRRLRDAGLRPEHCLIVIHASAGNPFRTWPAEHFVELIAALAAADPERRFVITSGPSDAGAAACIATEAGSRLGANSGAILRVDEFDLSELGELVARAALYVGGDSGPLHIAGTTRTPIVALLGPTLPARSSPWRDPSLVTVPVDAGPLPCRPCDQRRCEPGDFRCLTRLSARAVAAAAEEALSMAADRRASSVVS